MSIEGITTQAQSQALDKLAREHKLKCPCGGHKLHAKDCPALQAWDIPGACDCIPQPCRECKGSGEVRPYAETGIAGWLAERKCQECDGHGIFVHASIDGADEEECKDCHGSGLQPLWPALVWLIGCDGGTRAGLELWKSDSFVRVLPSVAGMSYAHALPLTVAFKMLAELCGWRFVWESDEEKGWVWSATDRVQGDKIGEYDVPWMKWLHADSESELLDKILAMEVKP
mgnify:CR=1 FL=1